VYGCSRFVSVNAGHRCCSPPKSSTKGPMPRENDQPKTRGRGIVRTSKSKDNQSKLGGFLFYEIASQAALNTYALVQRQDVGEPDSPRTSSRFSTSVGHTPAFEQAGHATSNSQTSVYPLAGMSTLKLVVRLLTSDFRS
jgi:hypothetical protein